LKKLLLFDIDGTLLRAENATRDAVNQTFRELFNVNQKFNDLAISAWTDIGFFRDAAIQVLGRPFNAEEYAVFIRAYIARLPGCLQCCKFYLMPGIAELLEHLVARDDILLGLETGNIEPAARLKLKRGGINEYFQFGGFGEDSDDRSRIIRAGIERGCRRHGGDMEPQNIFIIGDTPMDIRAGKKAGAVTVAVGTGILPWEDVLAEGPAHAFKDLSDVGAFLRCIGENHV
jgi:phosphoglycolate phosphatase